jgi:hypothetical protein
MPNVMETVKRLALGFGSVGLIAFIGKKVSSLVPSLSHRHWSLAASLPLSSTSTHTHTRARSLALSLSLSLSRCICGLLRLLSLSP